MTTSSDTPRTDALMAKMLEQSRQFDKPLTRASNLAALVKHARQLERELARECAENEVLREQNFAMNKSLVDHHVKMDRNEHGQEEK